MGRYRSEITVCDNTGRAQFNCSRSFTPGQGSCLFQLTGGTGGCGITGTGSGTCCQWTVPVGVTSVIIELWGGGGGGGAAPMGCQCCFAGGGGGGGAYARRTLQVVSGDQYTICVGSGGLGGGATGMSSSGSVCCCGFTGGTTYVTGTGLSNLCAEGGRGGVSRCFYWMGLNTPNGGWPGTGGDLNTRGYDGGLSGHWTVAGCWDAYMTYGGGSPFGGRNMYMAGALCAIWQDNCGNGKWGGTCGFTGNFPGGGGTGGVTGCCCGICACGGNGSPGLVRIWM